MLRWRLAMAGLLIGVALAVSPTASAVTPKAAVPFAITRLVIPLNVVQNGARASRSIYWQGTPTFPVTAYEHALCPEDINCGTRNSQGWGPIARTVFTSRRNPLVSSNFYFCNGGFTSNYVVGVEDWLVDAHGHRTAAVRSFWVCKTH